jgi:hypothetical protein
VQKDGNVVKNEIAWSLGTAGIPHPEVVDTELDGRKMVLL